MTSSHWRAVWNQWPRQFDAADHLRQVGRTIGGAPISAEQLDLTIQAIRTRLRVEPRDVILDLCCGNGMVTSALASFCDRIVGIDFSEPLIAIARECYAPSNVSYQLLSAGDLADSPLSRQPFTKILMSDALQFFSRDDFEQLLTAVAALPSRPQLMMFGGVPYRAYRSRWLNTPGKQMRYWRYRLTGRDLLGTWWTERDFVSACTAAGFQYSVHRQLPDLYNASFRVDLTVW